MGWRGLIVLAGAAMRRQHRAELRQLKELVRELQAQQRESSAAAESIVRRYEAQIAALTTVHRECGPVLDWPTLVAVPDPERPAPTTANVAAAEDALLAYRPSWWARTFGGAARRTKALEDALVNARATDEAVTAAALEDYQKACAAAAETRAIAAALLAKDVGKYEMVVEDAFDELREVGVEISLTFPNDATAVVDLVAHERNVVPTMHEALTKRGELSSKKMSKTRVNEIYQDYICGAALRVCREVFAALPVTWTVTTVRTDTLNDKNGHVELVPVLSMIAPRKTTLELRYEALDPSEAMSNFLSRMTFSQRGAGLKRIEPLTVADIPHRPPLGRGYGA